MILLSQRLDSLKLTLHFIIRQPVYQTKIIFEKAHQRVERFY